MFDDFAKDDTSPDAKKRLRGSILGAALVYTVAGAAIVAATATAKKVVEEELTQVEFAPPPEPEPEPEPPKVEEVAPKPAAVRAKPKKTFDPPDKVPLEKPKESDADLVAADEAGPVDGSLDGVEGGTGTGRAAPAPPPPPPPKPAGKVTPPVELDNPQPKYPKAAERKGIEGVVVVSFEVLEDGRCVSPKIVSGPEEFRDVVLKAVAGWKYRPAMQDGKKIRKRTTKRVVFQLT